MKDWSKREKLTVEAAGGVELQVFNQVGVSIDHQVTGEANEETFSSDVFKREVTESVRPEAVTKDVADHLSEEFNIDVLDFDITVIDPDDESVTVKD